MSKLGTVGLAFCVLLAACSGDASSPDAFDGLLDAIQRTATAKSFRVTITETKAGRIVAYYQAPDRLLLKPRGDVPVSIIIGSRSFIEDEERPGYFQELPEDSPPPPPSPDDLPPAPPPAAPDAPAPPEPSPPAPPARAAAPMPGLNEVGSGAVDVEKTPTGFRFRMESENYERGTATVRAGRVVEIMLFADGEHTVRLRSVRSGPCGEHSADGSDRAVRTAADMRSRPGSIDRRSDLLSADGC